MSENVPHVVFLEQPNGQPSEGWTRPITPLPATTYTPHDMEHWSFCTDDYCQVHMQAKENNNYWPKANTRRRRRNTSCDCGQPHHPDLDAAIANKHLNSKAACKAWQKGKRVCPNCEYIVNMDGHQYRCSNPLPSMTPDLPNASTLAEDGSDKENIPPSEPPASAGTQENPIYIHEDEPQTSENNESAQPKEQTMLDVFAAAAHAQEVATVSMAVSQQVLREGNRRLAANLTRQNQDTERLEFMVAQLYTQVVSVSRGQERIVERLTERRRIRRQRPFRNHRTRLVGASALKRGLMSRTVRDMLFGATIATAGLWVLAATIMLLRK
jgi:hypothetical protein